MPDTAISIDEAVEACRLAGNGMIPGKAPVMSPLKREASLVGLGYLNYIYQNDIANQHFCEAMLLMRAQAPGAAPNPYVALFGQARAAATIQVVPRSIRLPQVRKETIQEANRYQ
jgi:hypothetical protein